MRPDMCHHKAVQQLEINDYERVNSAQKAENSTGKHQDEIQSS